MPPLHALAAAAAWAAPALVAPAGATSVAELNARFRNGVPSNDVEAAGVLVHVIHGTTTYDWDPWLPCAEEWCQPPRKFFSCTLTSANLEAHGALEIGVYRRDHPLGFVLSPTANRLLCSYPVDGGSYDTTCTGPGDSGPNCTPGCREGSFPPDRLSEMLSLQARLHAADYNEVVLDAGPWVAHMPNTVEAVFFRPPPFCGSCREEALVVHRAFLQRYNLTSCDVPLVSFSATGWDGPFADASEPHAACLTATTTACPTAATTATTTTTNLAQEYLQPQYDRCFSRHATYHPMDMPLYPVTIVGHISDCQARCAAIPECAHFTYVILLKHCHVQSSNSTQKLDGVLFISGPPTCARDGDVISASDVHGTFLERAAVSAGHGAYMVAHTPTAALAASAAALALAGVLCLLGMLRAGVFPARGAAPGEASQATRRTQMTRDLELYQNPSEAPPREWTWGLCGETEGLMSGA